MVCEPIILHVSPKTIRVFTKTADSFRPTQPKIETKQEVDFTDLWKPHPVEKCGFTFIEPGD